MNTFREKLKQSGYDAEDAYFHKRDQELIEKMRSENAKPTLTLIQGGLKEKQKLPLLPSGRANKKAA